MDVVAHIIHELKRLLLTTLEKEGYKHLKASKFNWVITVPAIWGSDGKQMMREAGYMVSPKLKCVITRGLMCMLTYQC